MHHIINVASLCSLIGLLTVCGCASTKQFVPRPDPQNISPGKAQIQINRPGQIWGTANALIVVDNATDIGVIGPRGNLLWERDPGELNLAVGPKMLNMGHFDAPLIKVKAGYRYEFNTWLPFWYPFSRSGIEYIGEYKSTEQINED